MKVVIENRLVKNGLYSGKFQVNKAEGTSEKEVIMRRTSSEIACLRGRRYAFERPGMA